MNKRLNIIHHDYVTPITMGVRGIPFNDPVAVILRIYRHFTEDSLYRNSIFLMLSTGVMAFIGFFFWIINARLFTPEQVGIATTLISIITLISNFSILGLGNGLIRYLPNSKVKNKKINTSFSIIFITGLLLSLIYLSFMKSFSPSLLFIRNNIIFATLFIVFAIFSSLNITSESIFIAYRSAKYVLIKNTLLSIIKLSLPLVLIGLGAYGIFMSVGIAYTIASALALLILIIKFNYSARFIIDKAVLKEIGKFSFGNYVASFIGSMPTMILPIFITNFIGAKFSAYFYIDMMIANMIFIIPLAASQSLFAEGSYSETEFKLHLNKAVRMILLILLPTAALALLLGSFILMVFGKQYSNDGVGLLNLLIISSIFVAINTLGSVILNIRHKIGLLLIINVIGTLIILLLSFLLVNNHYGLSGLGYGYIIGQTIQSITYIFIIFKLRILSNKK